MADFSSFGEENFDPKDWINTVLKACPEGQHQSQVSTLVMKLQVLGQEMTQSLEDSSLQAIQNLPRAMKYIDRLSADASHLQKFMNGILDSLAKVEKDTESTVGFISEIDQVKGRMESCLKVLGEAQLVVSQFHIVKESFASNDYEEIAHRLQSMNRSLDVLKHIPEFSSKKKDIVQMEEQLANAIMDSLPSIFEKRDKEKAVSVLRVLIKINKSNVFYEHYFSIHARSVAALWSSSSSFEKDPLSFVKWLPRFYEEILTLIKEQTSWVADIFPDCASTLGQMIHKILQPQSTQFREKLNAVSTATPDSLSDVLACYASTKGFQRSVEALLQGADQNTQKLIHTTVFEPYIHLQGQYQILEMKRMTTELSELKLTSQLSTFHSALTLIEDSIPHIFIITESALDRCKVFTGGRESVGFCLALSAFGELYNKQLNGLVNQLRMQIGLDSGKHKDDVNSVDNSLKLLQISSTLLIRMRELQFYVKSQMMDFRSHLVSYESVGGKPFIQDPRYLKDDSEKLAKLLTFFNNLDKESAPFLQEFMASIENFIENCQKFVYDMTFYPIKSKLGSFRTLECWVSEPEVQPEGVYMPTFSSDPSSAITDVGGYLFTFLQEIAAFSFEGLLIIYPKTYEITGLGELKKRLGFDSSKETLEEDTEIDVFTTKWLGGSQGLLLDQIMGIAMLSDIGRNQLVADIEYLKNVIRAMGLTHDSILDGLVECLKSPLGSEPTLSDAQLSDIFQILNSKRKSYIESRK